MKMLLLALTALASTAAFAQDHTLPAGSYPGFQAGGAAGHSDKTCVRLPIPQPRSSQKLLRELQSRHRKRFAVEHACLHMRLRRLRSAGLSRSAPLNLKVD